MEIYLVRHTQTVCDTGVCYGQADVGIQTNFLPTFETIKSQIPIGALVYSSPLARCSLLAHYLANGIYETDSRLLEMNFGDWELKKWDAIPLEILNPWMDDFVNVQVPNGESFVQLYSRVSSFLDDLIASNPVKPIVIVTHAGVIRSVLCRVLNMPLQDAFLNKVAFGEVKKGCL